jgi:methylase of polypeptide subunit release factors
MSSPSLHTPRVSSEIEQHIKAELTALENKELRSQEQIEALARLLKDASVETFIQANKYNIWTLAYGSPLRELPVLVIDVISRPDGLRDIKYYKVLDEGKKWTEEELNPTQTNNRLFNRDFTATLLAEVKDAKVITPTQSAIAAIPDKYLAQELQTLVAGGKRITYVHGVPATWDHEVDQRAWSTNGDTVFFIDKLKAAGAFHPSVKAAAEVGCGTGAISQATLINCKNLEHFIYTDIDPNAINATRRNITPLLGSVSSQWFLGKGLSGIIRPGTLDLLLCNPPYLPDPNEDGDKDHYSGTKLIERIITEGMTLLNKSNPHAAAFIQASNLTHKDIEKYRKMYPDVEITPICEEFRVPLLNFHILNNRPMIEYLLKEHGLEDASNTEPRIKTIENDLTSPESAQELTESCRYFHKIIAYRIRPKGKGASE